MIGIEPAQGPQSSMVPLLQTRGLTRDFQSFRAVDKVDLTITEGTIHALVGPNGAGKTTLFNLLTGFLAPTSGSILFRDKDITGKAPEQIAHLGIARSFQITSLFDQLTGLEHLELALASSTGLGLHFWRSEQQMSQFRARSLELIDQVGLVHLADKVAGSLAYGQKRALELALALALDPALLLLDEPTAGMGMEDVERTIGLVKQVAKGRTVVFVDHNMHVVGNLAGQVTVLQQGQILAEGSYEQVRMDDKVITAYLGQAHA